MKEKNISIGIITETFRVYINGKDYLVDKKEQEVLLPQCCEFWYPDRQVVLFDTYISMN